MSVGGRGGVPTLTPFESALRSPLPPAAAKANDSSIGCVDARYCTQNERYLDGIRQLQPAPLAGGSSHLEFCSRPTRCQSLLLESGGTRAQSGSLFLSPVKKG